jgi:hypothetical protein
MNGDQARIRAELFKSACAGQFLTYSNFRQRLWPGMTGWRREWSRALDMIAMEERSHGYPDITFILHRDDANSPYPTRINFRDATNPDADQLETLREHTDQIISLYCPPGTLNPYR